MKMHSVTASDLARHTSEILERILVGESISVRRNQREIAYLVPAKRTMTAEQAIAGLAGKLTLAEGDSWLKESRAAFDETVADPWE
jgi:antitoxin (DNA-binding transcriptional repressor) of toxin-antitoxin stability system